MTFKTDFGYNEDNFIEEGRQLKELTVTITLCEYRALITENVRYEIEYNKLQEENERLKKQISDFAKLLIVKNPNAFNECLKAFGEFINFKEEMEAADEFPD